MTTEELEKEAEEYAYKNKIYIDFDNDINDYGNVKEAYLAGSEPREKRIAELEKENAELKEKLKPENCLKLLAKEGYIKFTSEQLTKAKEEIRSLYSIIQYRINYENNIEIADEMWRAKQFLKDNEVEK